MSDAGVKTPTRGERLKQLRQEHASAVERTQALFRAQKQLQQAICQYLCDAPRTVPEVAAAVGKPTHETLWFIAALKKYGIVVEKGMDGDYPLYQLAKEEQE